MSSKTSVGKAASAKKATGRKPTSRKRADDTAKNGREQELSANDLMFKAWQRFYRRLHSKAK